MDNDFQVGLNINYRQGESFSLDIWRKRYTEKLNEWFSAKSLRRHREMKPFGANLSVFKDDNDVSDVLGVLGEIWVHEKTVIFHEKGVIKLSWTRRLDHHIVETEIISSNREDQKAMETDVLDVFKPYILDAGKRFAKVRWFYKEDNIITSTSYFEQLDDIVHPEAYPFLPDMERYINDYLKSPESILLLIGPPGTGKTRLIRKILKTMADQDEKDIEVYSTSDREALESAKMFASFLYYHAKAMVLEDIDNDLKERKEGNIFMYKMLAVSDGVLAGQKKKIILSTNLPSVSAVDGALVRPGRCYDILPTRNLTNEEARLLLEIITGSSDLNLKLNRHEYSLAEVYRMAANGNDGSRTDKGKFRKSGFVAEATVA